MARILITAIALAGLTLAQPALAADAGAGAKVFKQNCALCHATGANAVPGVGPTLAGLVGRKAGTQSGYARRYSPAMKSSGVVWSSDNLKLYISRPSRTVPGNHMPFAGLNNPGQVDDLVTYLATLH